ncbi:stage II sporulation protein R [Paenibacillus spongiae]|uniref:Stage II sporulation protein R n=1 Tax=Paenibacillus spongiae TaxID=2909671 RepID=A0ABY5S7R7_9BACL|nr:stage II sporulation protein R [Paenibacillus spongiae]UVI29962.1 stage II sporulation protein R [Paenibacillus spongiae]
MIRTYSRFPYRPTYGYLLFVIAILLMSWEGQRADASIAGGEIPAESIRLRILANSDSPADQAVKRYVRDAVIAEMGSWVSGPQSIEQARATIRSRMGEIEQVVTDELRARGFTYSFKAELGIVPFPTKMYGNTVYPAGNYEALRITLGSGQGQNWWCVLFPPLCFVDAVSGEASVAAAVTTSADAGQGAESVSKANEPTQDAANANADPEVKFFLWEIIQSILEFFKNLFS